MSEKRSPERIAACKASCKKLYYERKEWNVCLVCGKPKKDGETTQTCKSCLESRAEYRKKHHDRILELQRDRISRFKAAGLCLYCGKPAAVPGGQKCEYHVEYYRQKNREQAQKRRLKRKEHIQQCKDTTATNASSETCGGTATPG